MSLAYQVYCKNSVSDYPIIQVCSLAGEAEELTEAEMRATFAGKLKEGVVWVGDVAANVPAAAARKLMQSPHVRKYQAHAADKSGGSVGELLRQSLFGSGSGAKGNDDAVDASSGRKLNCVFSCNNEGNEGVFS